MKIAKRKTPRFMGVKLLFVPFAFLALLIVGCCPPKCENCPENVEAEELWEGQYAQGIMQLNPQDDGTGLVAVNLVNSSATNKYLCIYKKNNAIRTQLYDTVYVKASKINGIPLVTELITTTPTEYTTEALTSMIEHRLYPHGSTLGIHSKTHIFKISRGYRVTGEDLASVHDIFPSNPFLFSKAETAFQAGQEDSQGRVDVYYALDNSTTPATLIDVDKCHYHGNVSQGCLD